MIPPGSDDGEHQTVEIHVDTETLEALRRVGDNLEAVRVLLHENARLLGRLFRGRAGDGSGGALKVS